MTLIEAVLVTFMPTLSIFLSIAITLKAAIKNNPSKSRKFSSEISAVEFCYSEIIVSEIHTNFTYDSKTYDIVKRDSNPLRFCLSLDSRSQFNLYIIVFNLVNVSHLIYWFYLVSVTYFIIAMRINLSDILYYFWEDKTPKIKRWNHCSISHLFISIMTGAKR